MKPSREIKRLWKRDGNGTVRVKNGDEFTVERRGIPLREWVQERLPEDLVMKWRKSKRPAKRKVRTQGRGR